MIINFGKKKIKIGKYKECRGIRKYIGLMFSGKEADVLVFPFSKPARAPIHSYFCPKFLAVWVQNKKVIETRMINKPEFLIYPKKPFDTLIEIPANKKNAGLIKLLNVSTKE